MRVCARAPLNGRSRRPTLRSFASQRPLIDLGVAKKLVGPSLQHVAPRRKVKRTVVSSAHFVLILMGERHFDPIGPITFSLVCPGRSESAKTMNRLFAQIAHPVTGIDHRV